VSNLLPLVFAAVLASVALEGRGGPPPSIPGILAFLAAWYAAGRALSGHLASRALRASAEGEEASLAPFHRALALQRNLGLAGQAFVLWPGGWAEVCRGAARSYGEVPAFLLALAPWVALLLLSAASVHPAEVRLGLRRIPLGASLLQSTRIACLLVAPLAVLAVLTEGAGALAAAGVPPFLEAADLAARYDFVAGLLLLAALAGTLVVFPVLAMAILGARPMPPGPLRERLEAYARRVGLGYRDLYVWPTRGTLPNAAVMGVGRRLRCVVFTDALLDRLDDEEVEAVFAHEAGHALHRHIPLFFLFTAGYALAMAASVRLLPEGVARALEEDGVLGLGAMLAGMVVYFGLLFGFVSRRLEQQADVHGLLTVGLPEGESPARVLREPERHPFLRAVAEGAADPGSHPFVRSLDGIAEGIGGVREITGWRHFSIADRVDFLRRFASDPSVRRLYRRRLRGLLALLGAVFAGFAAAAAADVPLQLRGPDPAAALDRAGDALRRGDVAGARGWIEAAAEGGRARRRVPDPGATPVPPGTPWEGYALLSISQAAEGGGGRVERFRLRECEALLRSVLGRGGEALAVAGRALDLAAPPGGGRPRDPVLEAEGLLLLSDLLAREGRPAAAAEARARAAAAAREAGPAGRRLLRAAER
jgi:STE24 endopeptidase